MPNPKLILSALGALAILAAIWLYGNSRYNAGVAATDAKWEAAGKKLETQAATASGAADRASADRVADHQDKLEAEKKAMDDAQASGTSVFDALFPR